MRVVRPVGGTDYPRTRLEFDEWFPDDAACLEYLGTLRWPDGFICPSCGGDRSWRTAGQAWMCSACKRKTSATAGTIFHRSHAPISSWFAAAWYVTARKDGVSALALQQELGLGSYETAWVWLQKLRRVMVRPDVERLAGRVEIAQTLISARSTMRGAGTPGGSASSGSGGLVTVLVAVERLSPHRLGRARFTVAEGGDAARRDVARFARSAVEPGSTIRASSALVPRRSATAGFEYEPAAGSTPTAAPPGAQLVCSSLGRWIAGTLRHHVSREHLPFYLDEYTFRFNLREASARGLLFYRLLQQAVCTQPHPFTALKGN